MSVTEEHPLKPFLPENTRLLMLGSFPPARNRWCMDFFYPNFINDMWRIFGIVFFGDKFYFVDNDAKTFKREDIISFLNEKGIGLYDTACKICRTKNTASDKDLEIVEATDLGKLLDTIPSCRAVITTGQKATDTFAAYFGISQPKLGESVDFSLGERNLKLFRMPSSSRAYPMKIERKAEYYERAFRSIELI
ncbi:uracil-DNA glycosylase family protein [uncultured Prevotella sp.]|uniref:uracil-DNA glycosylase family protein n=1 Tax=uncultured Prevotella sp. TaxID=159272 RepID=UPI0025E321A5|nr:uracil-DNA glycosylase family protein [uncultured Prevotella sp.]